MSIVDIQQLDRVSSTLLIPLWAKAVETRRPHPILRDERAAEIVETIGFDFRDFERKAVASVEFCIRARIIDQIVRSYLEANPDGCVVEVGVGLDTRFDRLDNGKVRWVELDLPEVMRLRKRFFAESDRRIMVDGSLLDDDWFREIQTVCTDRVLFVAEGVFYFFSEQQIRQVFLRLADEFPGSRFLFDAQSPLFLWYSNLRQPIDGARLTFSVRRPEDLERWDPRIRVERWVGFGDSPHYDGLMHRLSCFKRLIGSLHPLTKHLFKIIQIQFAG